MAISTYKTALMMGSDPTDSSSYSKLIDIKDFSDPEGVPDAIDTTTLSDGAFRDIPGIVGGDTLSFICNYTKSEYEALKELEGEELHLGIWFGGTVAGGVFTPTGIDGMFNFDAYLIVTKSGGGVNEAQNMVITLYKQSDLDFKEAISVTLNKDRVASDSSVTANVAVNLDVATPTLSYAWQKKSNGSWSSCGSTYTGYNTATLSAKEADVGKYYRCKVTASGSIIGVFYSPECLVVG